MQNLIVVMGKTSSSKDTICKYIKDNYGIDMVISNTTRPKRDYEIDGKEHWFLSDEQFDKLDSNKMLAYTKFPKTNYRYCVTLDNIVSDTMTYILNPDGVDYLEKTKDTLGINFFIIFCRLDEDTIIDRARKRGDKEELIYNRLDSEREEFDSFYEAEKYDYCIDTSKDLETIFKEVDKIMSDKGYTKVVDKI